MRLRTNAQHRFTTQRSAGFHPSGILKLVSANHKLSLEGAQEILAKNTVSDGISLTRRNMKDDDRGS